MNAASETLLDLTIKRTIKSSPQRLFRAWTQADELLKWFGPEGVSTETAEVDLRVGGAYRLVLRLPDGNTVAHHGHYREIRPAEKLVFTWILENQACDGSRGEDCETLVTVHFEDRGSATELTITHEFLPSEKARNNHEFGWNGCLDSLEQLLV